MLLLGAIGNGFGLGFEEGHENHGRHGTHGRYCAAWFFIGEAETIEGLKILKDQ